MRNTIISILLLCLLSSCDDIPNEVIENNFDGIRVDNIVMPEIYQPAGQSDELVVKVTLNNKVNLESLWFNVLFTNDNSKVLEKINLADDGENGDQTKDDKIFTGKTISLNQNENGRYKIEVFSLDMNSVAKLLAVRYFTLQKAGSNIAPVISNLDIYKNVVRGAYFPFSVQVDDANGKGDIQKVLVNIKKPDGSELNADGFQMNDTGDPNFADAAGSDGRYSYKQTFDNVAPLGEYTLVFKAIDNSNATSNLLEYKINLTSPNQNPIISELNIPSSIAREVDFTWTLKVIDQNELTDISKVLFFLERPDGSQIDPNGIEMYDDGNSNFGDQTAGDGIFSFKNKFTNTAQTGTWKFTFKAVDKSGAESNILTHNLVVE